MTPLADIVRLFAGDVMPKTEKIAQSYSALHSNIIEDIIRKKGGLQKFLQMLADMCRKRYERDVEAHRQGKPVSIENYKEWLHAQANILNAVEKINPELK